ncbi:YceI family protein [Wenyingzhuangia sp. IMCC45533]
MYKIIIPLLLLIALTGFKPKTNKVITRQGQVSFFSYTTAENIEAKNNQVLSILDLDNSQIAISMLMNTFVFKKSLMHEHFNESYIESDLYPKATFEGKIVDFDITKEGTQTKIIKGQLTIRNITKDIDIKTKINKVNGMYFVTGSFKIAVKDFDIKIPSIVAPNIAKVISTEFRFEYLPYEK